MYSQFYRQPQHNLAQYPCNHQWSYDWNHHYYNWDSRNYNLRSETTTECSVLRDYGPNPLVINIDEATKKNNNYRTVLWTGKHLQVALMSIPVGGDIGLELHPTTDQFIRIEEGQGLVQMGKYKDKLDYQVTAYEGYAIVVPAGTWHNLSNTGNCPLKVYTIYAPPEHPFGTVEATKAIAQEME